MRIQIHDLDDDELVAALGRINSQHQVTTAELLAHLIEVDARRLALMGGFSSLRAYATGVLGFGDSEAYHRIGAARTAARYPVVLEMVARGELSLSAINVLSVHLSADNHGELLGAARGKSKRAIQHLLAERFPKPDATTAIRKLPVRTAPAPAPTVPAQESPAVPALVAGPDEPARRQPQPPRTVATPTPSTAPDLVLVAPKRADVIEPTSRERYKVAFAAPRTLVDKLEQARNLLSHKLPGADLAELVELGLDLLIAQEEKRRFGVGARRRTRQAQACVPASAPPEPLELSAPADRLDRQPASAEAAPPASCALASTAANNLPAHLKVPVSRYVPVEVRRAVYLRDEGRCTFTDPRTGHRCGSQWQVELDHLDERALGGPNTTENLTLSCKRHNGLRARKTFGDAHIDRAIERSRGGR